MQNKKIPEAVLILPKEIFNTLMSALTYYVATESEIGETFFSKHAAKLKSKITRYCRIIKNRKDENDESVSIKFFGIESAMLLKLLTYYISLGENPTADYFTEMKLERSQKLSKHSRQ